MAAFVTFNLVGRGAVLPGHDQERVAADLARVMKAPADRARALVEKPAVLKRGLSLSQAEAYQKRLEALGLSTAIERVEPPRETSGLELALEPLDDEEPADAAKAPADEPGAESPAEFACPKCGVPQEKSEQCTACGVYFRKLAAAPVPGAQGPGEGRAPEDDLDDEGDDDEEETAERGTVGGVKALAAAAGAALLGAMLWKFIAVAFGWELGLLAWAIGGVVGFTAAALGATGREAGVACAVLVLLSILLGKYLALEDFKDGFAEVLTSMAAGDLRPMYDEELTDARMFETVAGEASLRQFMVDRGYTEAGDPAGISSSELADFNEYVRPRLQMIAMTNPDFETWSRQLGDQFADVSTFQLLQENFGFLDLIFLIMGMATAFRLASGEG